MSKNSLFFSTILCLSLSFLSSINSMQKLDQTGQLAQLPDDLKTELILRVAADDKTDASQDRVTVLNRMKCLVTTCKSMRDCFMGNTVFNKRLTTLLSHYPSNSGADFVKNTAIALNNCLIDRWLVQSERISPYATKLSDEEYQFRSKLIENRIKKLVQAGVDINGAMPPAESREGSGRILIEAVLELDTEFLRFLLAIGANINIQGDKGLTALSELVVRSVGYSFEQRVSFAQITQMIQILIDAGADIHIPDKNGKTALSHAIAYYRPDIAKFLIEKGARHSDLPLMMGHDVNHDVVIKTPLDYVWMQRAKSFRDSPELAEQWTELWTLMQKSK